MLRPDHQALEGNDRYQGFCVDMLKELGDILKFKYRIRLVGDGHYGVPGANGTWTGMVGELISRVSAPLFIVFMSKKRNEKKERKSHRSTRKSWCLFAT